MSAIMDRLANEIRSVDNRHSIGAADLAEALMPFIEREFISRASVAELIEAASDVAFIQINRRTPANDLGKAKQLRLRTALARIGGAA